MSLNYDAIEALTKKKYLKRLVDNVFKSTPFLSMLRERQQTYDGGYKIVEPLIYDELSEIKTYSFYDTISYDKNIPVTAAEFEPRNAVAPIIFSKDEELKNQGENQVLSLLQAKMEIAEKTFKKFLLRQFLESDGTGNSGKDFVGLRVAVADTGTYGGIDRSKYAWWKANVFANGGTGRKLTYNLMLRAFMAASDGTDKPDMIVCDKNTWMVFHDTVRNETQLITEPIKRMIGYGFNTLSFMGVPVVYEDHIDPADYGDNGVMYFLNSKYLKLRPHKNANFTTTKFRPADNMLAKKMEILWTGCLTLNNCRRHSILKDIDISDYYTAPDSGNGDSGNGESGNGESGDD